MQIANRQISLPIRTKVGAVTVDSTAHQIQQLQGAVKGLTKLIQGNKQNAQPQQIPQFVPYPIQNNSNPIPQASQNQNPANPQGGRGGRGGYKGRGGRGIGRGTIDAGIFYPKNRLTTR